MGESISDEALEGLLHKNLMQRAPTAGEITYWCEKVAGGELSQHSLAVLASHSQVNASNINLVGLIENGLEYA